MSEDLQKFMNNKPYALPASWYKRMFLFETTAEI